MPRLKRTPRSMILIRMEAKTRQKADFTYIVIYLLELLTGILFFIISGNEKRKKQHSIQAIVLGVISIVLTPIPIPFVWVLTLLIWIYGLYIGYMASIGIDVEIPAITDFAKKYTK